MQTQSGDDSITVTAVAGTGVQRVVMDGGDRQRHARRLGGGRVARSLRRRRQRHAEGWVEETTRLSWRRTVTTPSAVVRGQDTLNGGAGDDTLDDGVKDGQARRSGRRDGQGHVCSPSDERPRRRRPRRSMRSCSDFRSDRRRRDEDHVRVIWSSRHRDRVPVTLALADERNGTGSCHY